MMRPSRSVTRAVPCAMDCERSVERSKPWTAMESALQAGRSAGVAGRTVQPGIVARGGAALHAGERLADVEAEGGVERERAVVEGGLHEADASGVLRGGAVEHGLHEQAADAAVLCGGVDGDGADAVDDGALVEAVAAEDAVVVFSDDAVEAGRGEEHGEEAGWSARRRESRVGSCARG